MRPRQGRTQGSRAEARVVGSPLPLGEGADPTDPPPPGLATLPCVTQGSRPLRQPCSTTEPHGPASFLSLLPDHHLLPSADPCRPWPLELGGTGLPPTPSSEHLRTSVPPAHTQIHACTRTHACTHTCACTRIHTCAHTFTCAHPQAAAPSQAHGSCPQPPGGRAAWPQRLREAEAAVPGSRGPKWRCPAQT